MEILTSISNPTVQAARRLKDKRERDAQGAFVLEGANILRDLPDRIKVRSVFVQADKAQAYADILAKPCMPRPIAVSDKVMRALSDTVTPCGILAVADKPVCDGAIDGTLVVLDHISDPGNLGTILRTCVACGVTHVIGVESADAFAPKVVRASMGAILRLHVHETDADGARELLSGYRVCGMDMRGADLYAAAPMPERKAIVVGSEARGVTPQMRELVTDWIALPMIGDIESLNAAVSLSVALYQMTFGMRG